MLDRDLATLYETKAFNQAVKRNINRIPIVTKYMPYLPTESELIAEIEWEKRKLNLFREEEHATKV